MELPHLLGQIGLANNMWKHDMRHLSVLFIGSAATITTTTKSHDIGEQGLVHTSFKLLHFTVVQFDGQNNWKQ